MIYKEITGNLITLAFAGEFDVIAHGCNCFCTQKAGIAKDMAKYFSTSTKHGRFPLENESRKGDINKLGQIEWVAISISPGGKKVKVINCYTQYNYGPNTIDYDALTLCFKKINHIFKGFHIGLPKIGCGLAGGDWNIVKHMISLYIIDCNVTVVAL